MSDPLEVEEDEEETTTLGEKVRRIFGAGQRAETDNYTGSFRGVPAPKPGGRAYVKPEDTLGDDTHCWCGELAGHTWPGKEARAPHPPVQERKGSTMGATAVATEEVPRLEMRDLRKFDTRVARMMMELVNTYHVRYRVQKDGQHVFLYPLNDANGGRPHKVGAARHAEQTLDHLERWVKDAVTPALVTSSAELLAAKFNDPAKARKVRATTRAQSKPEATEVAPVESAKRQYVHNHPPVPDVPQENETPAALNLRQAEILGHAEQPPIPEGTIPAPEGYTRVFTYKSARRGWTNWWGNAERNHFICMWGDFECENLQRHAAHMRKHTQSKEKLRASAVKASVTRRQNRETAKIVDAIQALMDATGVQIVDERPSEEERALRTEIEILHGKIEAITAERDTIKAKLDLLREAISL